MKHKTLAFISASACAAGVAKGAIIYSGVVNMDAGTNSSFGFDLNNDGTNDFTVESYGFAYKGPVDYFVDLAGASMYDQMVVTNDGSSFLLPLPAGTQVPPPDAEQATFYGSGEFWSGSAGYPGLGFWTPAEADAYVGLELVGEGTSNYGWAHFVGNFDVYPPNFTLQDFAYETVPGRPILTGATYDPAPVILSPGNGQIQISWPSGVLQSADSLEGPYSDVPGAQSPMVITPTNTSGFFRLRL